MSDTSTTVFTHEGIDYDANTLARIITRDGKNQKHKRDSYLKWLKTDKGKETQRRASKKYYDKKKAKILAEETINNPENPQDI